MQESEHVSFLIQRLSGFDTVSKDPRNNCFVLRPRSDELPPEGVLRTRTKKNKNLNLQLPAFPAKGGVAVTNLKL